MELTKNALDVMVSIPTEDSFDDAMVELVNRILLEVKKNPRLVAIAAKHFTDPRTDKHFIEILIDEKESE